MLRMRAFHFRNQISTNTSFFIKFSLDGTSIYIYVIGIYSMMRTSHKCQNAIVVQRKKPRIQMHSKGDRLSEFCYFFW